MNYLSSFFQYFSYNLGSLKKTESKRSKNDEKEFWGRKKGSKSVKERKMNHWQLVPFRMPNKYGFSNCDSVNSIPKPTEKQIKIKVQNEKRMKLFS